MVAMMSSWSMVDSGEELEKLQFCGRLDVAVGNADKSQSPVRWQPDHEVNLEIPIGCPAAKLAGDSMMRGSRGRPEWAHTPALVKGAALGRPCWERVEHPILD